MLLEDWFTETLSGHCSARGGRLGSLVGKKRDARSLTASGQPGEKIKRELVLGL